MKKQNATSNGKLTDLFPDATYRLGDIIARRYQVHSILGHGGFGEVYLVYDNDSQNIYALKTFHKEFLADPETRNLFRKEANILVELGKHPYLVNTFFIDEVSGRLIILMEHIAPNEQGLNSLAGYLQTQPPSLEQSLRWTIQVCLGMEYAVSKGIGAHRDIKPENILVSQDGIAKISDFGLAGRLDLIPKNFAGLVGNSGVFNRTQKGVAFGTPTHMSPEQFIDAASCDVRSDIYSFGVVLFQMASKGYLPFLAAAPRNNSQEEGIRFVSEMQELHSQAQIPRLDSVLSPLIIRCLEKQPNKRYQSFAELRLEAERILKAQTGEVIKPPPVDELSGWELNSKGNSLIALGRYEDALHYYDRALQLHPRYALALTNKSRSLYLLGRYEESLRVVDKALELAPNFVTALNNKANSLDALERYEEAIRIYDAILKIDPQYVSAWSNKADLLNKIGRYQDALLYSDKALELDPLNALALFTKANSLDDLGRYEEAVSYYDKALEINPQYAVALNNKGVSLEKLERYEEAILCYDKSLEIDPKYALAFNSKGVSLEKLGRHDQAMRCYDQALKFDSRFVEAWGNKGCLSQNLGKYQDAISCYDNALAINPHYQLALNNKGNLLKELGRYEEAIQCLEKALSINAGDENIVGMASNLYNLAAVNAQQGKLFIALILAQQSAHLYSLARDPRHGELQQVISQIKAALAFPLDAIIERIQKVSSPAGIQELLLEYPIMMNPDVLDHFYQGVPDVVPWYARSAYKKHQDWLVPCVNEMSKNAHQLFFNQVDSLVTLHLAVKQYPFMINERFIQVAEQVISQQIPHQNRSAYLQLTNWLKQIAAQV